jgi:hypothetical protein
MRRWTQEEKDFVAKHKGQMTYLEISQQLNRPLGGVQYQGTQLNTTKEHKTLTKKFLTTEYLHNNKTLKQISHETNIPPSTIQRWAKKYKIPVLTTGGNVKNVDISGQIFGRLTVIERILDDSTNKAIWKCQCECGNIHNVARGSLLQGLTKSCGCLQFDRMYKGHKGLSGKYWYRVLRGAKKRNLNIAITIEDAWNQFEKQNKKCALTGVDITLTSKFKGDTASLDRIDSTKGYEINNIQWTHKDINLMKSNIPERDFIKLCKLVANYN